MLRTLGDLTSTAAAYEPCRLAPALVPAHLLVPSEALDGVEEAAQVEVLPFKHRAAGAFVLGLLPLPGEEAGVLELERVGVARRGAGLEMVDGLGLRWEGEGVGVERERRAPGLRRDDAADAEGLGGGADLVDVV